MMASIRFYLFTRGEDAHVDVDLYTSAVSMVEAWRKRVKEDSSCGAALAYAGAGRPSTGKVSGLLESFAEKVLVSESARWHLPPECDEVPGPVGHLPSSRGRREQSVYMARAGWGYELKDEEVIQEIARHRAENEDVCPCCGRSPEKEEQASEDHPEDFEARLSQVNADDPAAVLSILPAWLLDAPIDEISLPTRCRNIAVAMGCESVRDLQQYSTQDMLRWRNFGRKSATGMAQAFIRAARTLKAKDVRGSGNEEAGEQPDARALETLQKGVEAVLRSIGQRNAAVALQRFGYSGGGGTLKEIGSRFSITPERVRQIEERAKNLLHASGLPEVLSEKLGALFMDRTEPLYLDLLRVEDPWFAGVTRPAYFTSLLGTLSDGAYHVLAVDARQVVARLSQEDWDQLKDDVLDRLTNLTYAGTSERQVELTVESSTVSRGASELTKVLYSTIENQLHFSEDAPRQLLAVGRHLTDVVTAVLRDASNPLHYEEVADRCEARLGEPVSVSSTHSTVRHIGIRLGPGEYGMENHIPLDDEQRKAIIAEVERIQRTGPLARQWHASELLKQIERALPNTACHLNKFKLNAILENSDAFVSLGRMVWVSKQAAQNGTQKRVHLSNACESILRRFGRPMSEEELKREIKQVRGVNDLPLLLQEPIIRIGPGVWGLIDRDIRLSDQERERLMNDLYYTLQHIGYPLHRTELRCALEEVAGGVQESLTPHAIASLAQLDDRFDVDPSHTVHLAAQEQIA